MTKVAINGFGRIGRLFFRLALENKDVDVLAINDLGNIETLAYLLKYDTVYGRFSREVEIKNENLVVAEKEIKCFQEKDPENLPWGDLGIDIVVESTGVFTEYQKAKKHIEAGAKRVVITAPSEGDEGVTVLMGINENGLEEFPLSSNASCTTNAASPVIKVIDEEIGIEKAILNTVHGYTSSQNIVDVAPKGSKVRRGRAAAQNIIPSTTGAAKAVAKAIPEMEGKFDGIALRVPVIAGSIADITFISKRDTSVEEVNKVFKKAAADPRWEGVLKATDEPIVSSDIIGEPYGAIVDLSFTRVVGGNLVKVLSWYDNEFGYASTLLKHVVRASKLL
jgi:glyceraldehyde 3-phosphate dehydrogenase